MKEKKNGARGASISLKKTLSGFFERTPEVKTAYLYGSQALGKTGPLSDVDVAVLLDNSLDAHQRFRLILRLTGELSEILGGKRIDLVDINSSPLLLKENILKNGVLISTKDEDERVRTEVAIMREYLDRDYYVQRRANTVIKRIASAGLE